MDCIQALFGGTFICGLLVVSEMLPFVRQIRGNSIVQVVVSCVKYIWTVRQAIDKNNIFHTNQQTQTHTLPEIYIDLDIKK